LSLFDGLQFASPEPPYRVLNVPLRRGELLLGTPVRRSTVLAGKLVAMTASVGIVSAAFVVTLIVGAPLVDLSIGSSYVIAATLMLALLAVMFGSVGLLLGALSGHRAVALGAGFGLAIAAWCEARLPLAGLSR